MIIIIIVSVATSVAASQVASSSTTSHVMQSSVPAPGHGLPSATSNGIHVIPGHKQYSQAHVSTTAIVSDSMVGSLRNNTLNSYIQGKDERVVVGKNPGATARQIAHNSIFTITEEAPKVLVVVAGANDILRQSTNGNVPNEVTIVEDIHRSPGKIYGCSRCIHL